jgi:hypothetical protein
MTLRVPAGIALASALALGLHAPAALAQCAMCQATLVGSAEGRALQGPLNSAILLLFAAPYLVFGCFVLMAFRERILRRMGQAVRAGLRARPARLSR